MSRQQTLEQQRAAYAWKCIQKIKTDVFSNDPNKQKEYGSLAKSAPADIQTNGLGQTLAFWRAKSSKEGKLDSKTAHFHLLQHVTGWLNEPDSLNLGIKELVKWVVESAKTTDYRRATTETIAFLVWLKRFAEAELP